VGGQVINCAFEGEVSGLENVGGLVGFVYEGLVNDCHATADVSGTLNIGGLIGSCDSSGILRSDAVANVVADTWAGGLVGHVAPSSTSLSESWAAGSVTGVREIGGLVGFSGAMEGHSYYGYGGIRNCYALTTVQGQSFAGGLVGLNAGTITKCYAAGSVSADSGAGGLVATGGGRNKSLIEDSFWDVNNTGLDTSGGGTGLTTTQMYTRQTFLDAGWDLDGEAENGKRDYWRMCQDTESYPTLRVQQDPSDLACPNGIDLADFAVLARDWHGWSYCDDFRLYCMPTDIDRSEQIDARDLAILADQWLEGVE
jgi:hypothetical protein